MANKSPVPAQSKTGVSAQSRTLGPVSDLERHLSADWWRTLFNAVYLTTDGDVFENDANTRADVDRLIALAGLVPEDRVLDLCCGQGRHLIELARRGFTNVSGVDRSRYLIRLARRRAKAAGVNVTFHEGDVRRFRVPEGSVDCVTILGNSFGYFATEEEDKATLTAVKRALRSRGMLVIELTDGDWLKDHFERRSWEWVDQEQFVCRERSLDASGERLVTREVVVHADEGVIADQFYAERLYGPERIKALLETTGFTGVRIEPVGETASDRGQDLGMMARRLLVLAVAPHKVAAKRGRAVFPEVTVIMGDPRLPDPVKKGGVFNPEDHATVDKLREALGAIDGYGFAFMDNHASLIQELRARPPAFVLNLCDEGYDNDAFKELHVPALLEMLGVPYTGAGPACLGLCYDKALVRAIAAQLDIPVPLETYFDPADQAATLPSIFPALIKPATGDSSIGITKDAVVHDAGQAVAYLRELRQLLPGRAALVQEFLSGAEYSVGLIGNPGTGLRALPVLEVDYSQLGDGLPRILGYESKWHPDSPYWTSIHYREALVDEDTRRRMVDHSSMLFERLGCRDYARFDWRMDAEGTPKLLEVNPNPGWSWDAKMNMMMGFAGESYTDLLRHIIQAAEARIASAQLGAVAVA